MSPWKVLVFAAPITAILALIALEQRQEVGLRLERAEVQARITEDKFDREFTAFSAAAPTASVEAERSARLQKLEAERDDYDARLRQNLQRLDQDSAELRGALEDLDSPTQKKR